MPECRNTDKKAENVRCFNLFGHDKLRTSKNVLLNSFFFKKDFVEQANNAVLYLPK